MLTVPLAAVAAVWRHVRDYGVGRGVETGGFLLAPRADELQVEVVALTGSLGVLREPYSFGVTGEAIEQLAEWAELNGMLIAAQFHSHEGPAFLSPIDKAGGYRIEGFLSAVLPDFGDPPRSMNAWSWWRFEGSDWVSLPPPRASNGRTALVVFDANGLEHLD